MQEMTDRPRPKKQVDTTYSWYTNPLKVSEYTLNKPYIYYHCHSSCATLCGE